MASTKSWDNTTARRFREENPGVTFVDIRDEVEPYCRALDPGETFAQACEEFAATYDKGDYEGVVECVGRLWPADAEIEHGGEAESVVFGI